MSAFVEKIAEGWPDDVLAGTRMLLKSSLHPSEVQASVLPLHLADSFVGPSDIAKSYETGQND